ncbi:MAG: YafY family protein [Ornithinimicrobium sp.]
MTGTTQRVLRLLSLLQSAPPRSGADLAQRLDVTPRCIRRDIARLRDLGYPVISAHGIGGGYRLGAGTALPPLLLDDEEAIAVAVSLRLAAGGSVARASEAALRTLTKLDAVTPPRLREEIRAITDATETLVGDSNQVDGETLLMLARACRDTVRTSLRYEARDGTISERTVEPVRLVATGRRWYLMAWDRSRDDWRTFRLDRICQVNSSTMPFTPREHPDPADFVQACVTSSPYRYQAVVRVSCDADAVRARVSPSAVSVRPETDTTCLAQAGGDDLEHLALHFASLGFAFEVIEPPALAAAMVRLGARLTASAALVTQPQAQSVPGIPQPPVV